MEFEGQMYVNMISVFADTALLERVVKQHGAIEGGKQYLARLAGYLAKQQETTP